MHRTAFGGESGRGERLLDHSFGVVCVVNRKISFVAQHLNFSAQDSNTQTMKSADPALVDFWAAEFAQPLAHFSRRFVGEGYRKHFPRGGQLLRQDVRDAVHEHARFSTARTREDQKRAFGGGSRVELLSIEP